MARDSMFCFRFSKHQMDSSYISLVKYDDSFLLDCSSADHYQPISVKAGRITFKICSTSRRRVLY